MTARVSMTLKFFDDIWPNSENLPSQMLSNPIFCFGRPQGNYIVDKTTLLSGSSSWAPAFA